MITFPRVRIAPSPPMFSFCLNINLIDLIFPALVSRIWTQIRNTVNNNDDVGKQGCIVCFLRSAGESICFV